MNAYLLTQKLAELEISFEIIQQEKKTQIKYELNM